MTINITELQGSSLGNVEKGRVFLGRAASDALFIVGTINNDFKVAVNLASGKFDLVPLDAVKTRRGFVARNHQTFVDVDARTPINLFDEPGDMLGALVMSENRIGLLAQNLKHDSLHFVSLINDPITEEANDVVAFLDWAICAQDESGAWNKLFEFGGGKAAAGLERL